MSCDTNLARDLKITDQMVEAAVMVLWSSGRLGCDQSEVDYLITREMLEAAIGIASGGNDLAQSQAPETRNPKQ